MHSPPANRGENLLHTSTSRALALALVAVVSLATETASAQTGGSTVTIGAPAVYDPKLTNPDGSPAQATITGEVDASQTVDFTATLAVLDAKSTVVRTFAATTQTTGMSFTTTWDGKNDSGALVAPGS